MPRQNCEKSSLNRQAKLGKAHFWLCLIIIFRQIQHCGLDGSFSPLESVLFNNVTEVGQRYFLSLTHMGIFSTDQNNEPIC